VNGDDVRDVGFPRLGGYDASQVDDLLQRVAMELDAGRPVGPLIANATFRRRGIRGYDIEAVDWFLDQLRSREDHGALARMCADPWRGLAVAKYCSRSGPGLGQECAAAWRDFGEVPGMHLRWVWAGAARRELRTAEQQTIASRHGWSTTAFSTGGRTFTRKQVTGSSLPDVAEIADRQVRDFDGHFLDPDTPRGQKRQAKASSQKPGRSDRFKVKEFRDETGTPVLYTSGMHFNGSAEGCITFPDQRWLRFPVRCTRRANAIMTAVDQDGKKVARYRVTGWLWATTMEVTVHPDWKLTDELVLAILISAPWLPYYFIREGGG
jgi:DivIVA domain-containing protein